MSPGRILYLTTTMGIRLFPCQDNDFLISELVNVPSDTKDRLDYIKEQAQEEKADWRPEYRERIQHDPDLMILDEFLTSGWGTFAYPTDTMYGDTNDPELARKLFDSATNKHLSDHIPFERILLLAEGFYWY